MPVYNVEKYLAICIRSLLAQSYKNIEIILVDDGSTDTSGAICDKFAAQSSKIQVIHKRMVDYHRRVMQVLRWLGDVILAL